MARQQRKVPWLDWRDGVAYVFWYDAADGRTKRISLATKDPRQAQARFAAFLTQGEAIREPARLVGLSVWQALDDYFQEHVQKKVIDTGRQQIAINHLKAFFKHELLKDVDIASCEAYRAFRRSVSDPTVRRELQIVGAAANHAMRRKRLGRDELPIMELPPDSVVSAIGEDEWLTKDEVRFALSQPMDIVLYDLMVLAYCTASRKTAIENLTVAQVDLTRGLLTLRHPDETILERRSKKRRPVVPITPEMRPILEQLVKEPFAGGRLFPEGIDFYHRMKNHMTSIGLGHKGNPHVLRHSRATHLLMDGVSIYDVAKLLGDTIATVERVYGHYCPEYLGRTLQQRS
jgi:integrase